MRKSTSKKLLSLLLGFLFLSPLSVVGMQMAPQIQRQRVNNQIQRQANQNAQAARSNSEEGGAWQGVKKWIDKRAEDSPTEYLGGSVGAIVLVSALFGWMAPAAGAVIGYGAAASLLLASIPFAKGMIKKAMKMGKDSLGNLKHLQKLAQKVKDEVDKGKASGVLPCITFAAAGGLAMQALMGASATVPSIFAYGLPLAYMIIGWGISALFGHFGFPKLVYGLPLRDGLVFLLLLFASYLIKVYVDNKEEEDERSFPRKCWDSWHTAVQNVKTWGVRYHPKEKTKRRGRTKKKSRVEFIGKKLNEPLDDEKAKGQGQTNIFLGALALALTVGFVGLLTDAHLFKSEGERRARQILDLAEANPTQAHATQTNTIPIVTVEDFSDEEMKQVMRRSSNLVGGSVASNQQIGISFDSSGGSSGDEGDDDDDQEEEQQDALGALSVLGTNPANIKPEDEPEDEEEEKESEAELQGNELIQGNQQAQVQAPQQVPQPQAAAQGSQIVYGSPPDHVEEEVLQDGTRIWKYDDGRVQTNYSSGGELWELEDGTEVLKYADGGIKTKYPDGKTIIKFPEGGEYTEHTEYPDGTQKMKFSNGKEETKYPEGKIIIKYPDGKIKTIHPDGTQKMKFRSGTVMTRYPEGIEIWKYTEGGIKTIHPNGKIIWKYPDGKIKTKYPDGREVWGDPSDKKKGTK